MRKDASVTVSLSSVQVIINPFRKSLLPGVGCLLSIYVAQVWSQVTSGMQKVKASIESLVCMRDFWLKCPHQ